VCVAAAGVDANAAATAGCIYVAEGLCGQCTQLPMPDSLRNRHPNLMLRVRRAMRILQIETTPWRIRYVKLYCALAIMQPESVPAFGARGRNLRQRSLAFMMQNVLHDCAHPEMDDGVTICSNRLRTQIELMERQLRVASGLVLIE